MKNYYVEDTYVLENQHEMGVAEIENKIENSQK